MRFRPAQLKAISEFLNTVAAAWFTAGIISPLFIGVSDSSRNLFLTLVSVLYTLLFLGGSVYLVRKVRL